MEVLLVKHGFSKSMLAEAIQKSPSYISNYLRLLKLPEVIQDALLSGIVSEGHSRALSFLDDQSDMVYLFEEILRHGYSVRETERLSDKMRGSKRTYGKVHADIKEATDVLAKKLGVPVKVQRKEKEIEVSMFFPVGVVSMNKVKKLSETVSRHFNTEG